jgi:hypothetical protein
MKTLVRSLFSSAIVASSLVAVMAQAPAGQGGAAPGGGRGGPPRPVLWVTSTGWSDGGEVPMKHAGRGENKSPAFEFHWNLGPNPGTAPDNLQTYAVIFHDIENSTNRGTSDTLHWSAPPRGYPRGWEPATFRTGRAMARASARGAAIQARILDLAPARDHSTITSSSSMRSTPSWNFRQPRRAMN